MNDTNEKYRELMGIAKEAYKASYAPYSDFHVGAALLGENGRIYKGVNVENGSFGATNCAERTAIFSAVADGCRSFEAIAIAADGGEALPCGICRQVLSEFCGPDFPVITEREDGELRISKLSELLPLAFKL